MKKYFLVAFCALLLVAVTGCGGKKNQVTCKASASEGGINMTAEITAEFDDSDKLKDATIVYDLGDSTVADQYCSLFKLMEDADNGVKVSCSGKKVTISGYASLADDSEEGSLVGVSKEDFIKYVESSEDGSYTCEK